IACLLLAGVACIDARPTTTDQPLLGDWNLNGRLDFGDVTGLFAGLGGPYRADCDMNANGRMDFADVVLLWGRL
ncbi:MAG TPA: hypothetical protein HA263_08165, partial [Methanoregulaceae archaeon]|nr:hypothetical protein [Methanoregulaceae archaeon]